MEDPQLSSYPLKVATLHYAKEKNNEQNQGHVLFVDSLNILKIIDDNQDGHSTLRSFTIANEPIFKENDKSHLQVRRLAAPLRDIESEILIVGLIQTMLLFVPIVGNLLEITNVIELSGKFLSGPFIVIIVFHLSVILWLLCSKFIVKESVGLAYKRKILYQSHIWPLYLHSVFFVLQIITKVVSWWEILICLCFLSGVVVTTRFRMIYRWQWIFLGPISRTPSVGFAR